MAMFVHLAPESAVAAIRRSGIKVAKASWRKVNGVFAMPVTPNFYISHQWLRELRRSGQRSFVGVYFRVPDDEPVSVGHYNSAMVEMSAAAAAGLVHGREDGEGYQIVVARKILPGEVHRIRHLPQVIGWRYQPDVRAREFCGCPVCVSRGEFGSQEKRRRWKIRDYGDAYRERVPPFEALKTTIEAPGDPAALSRALYDLASKRRRAPCGFLEPLIDHEDPDVRSALVHALASFIDPLARQLLERLAACDDWVARDLAKRKLAGP